MHVRQTHSLHLTPASFRVLNDTYLVAMIAQYLPSKRIACCGRVSKIWHTAISTRGVQAAIDSAELWTEALQPLNSVAPLPISDAHVKGYCCTRQSSQSQRCSVLNGAQRVYSLIILNPHCFQAEPLNGPTVQPPALSLVPKNFYDGFGYHETLLDQLITQPPTASVIISARRVSGQGDQPCVYRTGPLEIITIREVLYVISLACSRTEVPINPEDFEWRVDRFKQDLRQHPYSCSNRSNPFTFYAFPSAIKGPWYKALHDAGPYRLWTDVERREAKLDKYGRGAEDIWSESESESYDDYESTDDGDSEGGDHEDGSSDNGSGIEGDNGYEDGEEDAETDAP